MKIIVTEEKKALEYIVLDHYKEGLSAMARTTGYVNTALIELLNKTRNRSTTSRTNRKNKEHYEYVIRKLKEKTYK